MMYTTVGRYIICQYFISASKNLSLVAITFGPLLSNMAMLAFDRIDPCPSIIVSNRGAL